MSINVTNQKDSQALAGQGVTVTLDNTDAAQLANMEKGMVVTATTSGQTGTIHSVDYYGNSFKVIPTQMNQAFWSGTYGYLAANQGVTITN